MKQVRIQLKLHGATRQALFNRAWKQRLALKHDDIADLESRRHQAVEV